MPADQEQFDVAIVGGGIVGLATAHQLLERHPGLDLVLCEKEDRVGAHQTGHNSGVVHSGLYYAPGSEKARTCVRGAAAMLTFCRDHAIAHEICGKVVVATQDAELPRLENLEQRGHANGVPGLRRIGKQELNELEPHAAGVAALHVPGAAIVDYAAVAQKLAQLIRESGGEVRTATHVVALTRDGGWHTVRTAAGRSIRARSLVACAGLQSDRITRAATGEEPARIVPFRGDYHELRRERCHLVRGLIYPVPDPRFPFLGVHFTRLVGGGVEAGPNAVLALSRERYRKLACNARDTFDILTWPGTWRLAMRHFATGCGELWRSLSKRAFARALRRLVPAITPDDLSPGGFGIRAQALSRNGALVDDFLIVERERALFVCNAPSPAATASLAIAEQLAARIDA